MSRDGPERGVGFGFLAAPEGSRASLSHSSHHPLSLHYVHLSHHPTVAFTGQGAPSPGGKRSHPLGCWPPCTWHRSRCADTSPVRSGPASCPAHPAPALVQLIREDPLLVRNQQPVAKLTTLTTPVLTQSSLHQSWTACRLLLVRDILDRCGESGDGGGVRAYDRCHG